MALRIRTRTRAFLLAALGAACAVPASAQWSAGGAWGVTENVSHKFSLDELKSHDLSGWIQYETQPEVQVRATVGTMETTAPNSERFLSAGAAPPVLVPRLTSKIDYAMIGVSYEFVTGDYASGLFAGIGGYKIRPDSTPAGFEFAADPSRTVLGWHIGVDGTIRLVSRLSGVGRLTVHGFEATNWHAILTATAGLSYRF